ncbi:MAG: hypothetical protein H8E60_05430 [Candidatus Marinimicrobia bacterium]|nr:hypothetical protein [Candidatus Neomarinimicrobiota bacterium]
MVNFIYKISWVAWLGIIIFFRDDVLGKIIILVMAILLSIIAVVRALNARNAWRPIAEEYHKELDD